MVVACKPNDKHRIFCQVRRVSVKLFDMWWSESVKNIVVFLHCVSVEAKVSTQKLLGHLKPYLWHFILVKPRWSAKKHTADIGPCWSKFRLLFSISWVGESYAHILVERTMAGGTEVEVCCGMGSTGSSIHSYNPSKIAAQSVGCVGIVLSGKAVVGLLCNEGAVRPISWRGMSHTGCNGRKWDITTGYVCQAM